MDKKIIHNFIDGKPKIGSGNQHPIYSPVDGNVLGYYHDSTTDDINLAVENSKRAQVEWAKLTNKARSQVVYKYRELLLRDREKLAELCHRENGKSMAEALAGADKAIELSEYAASLPQLLNGGAQFISTGIECRTIRKPLGVVASITPFNFPIMVPHWTVPNAIATGNAIILKPSEVTPLSAIKSAELWKEAGLPDGLVNVVIGAKESVEAICDHPNIQAVTFVGSTPVAELVYRRSAQHLKRVMTYGGAKNYMILTESAHPRSGDDIIAAFCGMSGQRCMAASVMITVGNGINVAGIKANLIKKVQAMKAGKDLPALISPNAIAKIGAYLDNAKKLGATITVDGRNSEVDVPESNRNGYYLGPSVIDWTGKENAMPFEEVFGPTLEILHADTLEDALLLQNTSPYGNGTAVFTQNGRIAQEAVAGLQAGMIGVNVGIPVPREPFSFGGIKKSRFGQGGITGWPNVEFFTDDIKVTTRWNPEDKKDWMS